MLTIRERAFKDARIELSGVNIAKTDDGSFRILGIAERDGEGCKTHLGLEDETWAVGAIAKDAEGKVVGLGDCDIRIHKSPIAAFSIFLFTVGSTTEDVVEVELYPFVKRGNL